MSDLLAPPYDVISPREAAELRGRSPYNAIHLEMAEEGEGQYEAVAQKLEAWTREGVLERDATPNLYVYEQLFRYEGKDYARRGMIAGVEAQPWEEGAVKPHEYTLSGPKEDRLNLLKATKTQFSPVFMLARDRAGQLRQFIDETIASSDPDVTGTSIDGEEHRLWIVEAGRLELRRLAPLLSETFYIADGHHRYETAVNYRNYVSGDGKLERDDPARFTMTSIVPVDDPGLVIRPIHRWVAREVPGDWRERLEQVFDIVELPGSDTRTLEAALAEGPRVFAAVGLEPGKTHRLSPKADFDLGTLPGNPNSAEWAGVAPNLLRLAVLNPLWNITDAELQAGAVDYLYDMQEVQDQIKRGGGVVLLVNPVQVQEVIDLADKGERMPQKSTFFHPKLGTGLVFNPLYA